MHQYRRLVNENIKILRNKPLGRQLRTDLFLIAPSSASDFFCRLVRPQKKSEADEGANSTEETRKKYGGY